MSKRLILAVVLSLLIPVLADAQVLQVPFGKNLVNWDDKEMMLYQTEHFDVYSTLNPKNEEQMTHLSKTLAVLESSFDWLGGAKVYDHRPRNRISAVIYASHNEFESNNITMTFLPEGVGAFVDYDRNRLVGKEDLYPHLKWAVYVHEVVHIFQHDIENPGALRKMTGSYRLPNGFYEGGAEFLAGIFFPHNRDDIRRDKARMYASNPKMLPTWEMLVRDQVDPYVLWEMLFSFLEKEFGKGVEFQVAALKDKNYKTGNLGHLLYRLTRGELGNPDVNSDKFNQHFADYFKNYELERLEKPKPHQITDNFEGRSISPQGWIRFIFSPILSPDGKTTAVFTINKGNVALVRFDIPAEPAETDFTDDAGEPIASDSDDPNSHEKELKNEIEQQRKKLMAEAINLTPQMPPIPFEYIVVQGLETWPFNGFDSSWSHDGKKIALLARKNRDHVLYIVDAEKPKKIIQSNDFSEMRLDQAFSPSFSPDDKKVYFSAAKDITRDIYVIDLESGEVSNLTNDFEFDTAPAVSPDGRKLVYVSSNGATGGGFQHLFLLDLETGVKEQLTFGRFNDNSPSWSDDGKRIFYTSDEIDQVWNLYTLDFELNSESGVEERIVRQRTNVYGGVHTPVGARNNKDKVYAVAFKDADRFLGYGPMVEYDLYEFKLKRPIRQYSAHDTKESMEYSFTPLDLFQTGGLDPNQILNPQKPFEKWKLDSGEISVGYVTGSQYYLGGMLGRGWMKVSNILETKHYLFTYVSYGNLFKAFDFTHLNQGKRLNWGYNASYQDMPFQYFFYDIAEKYPKNQFILNYTRANEFNVNLFGRRPIDKWNRLEFGGRIRKKSYSNYYGITEADILASPEFFTANDLQVLHLFEDANGTSLSFVGGFVRDTVLYNSRTQGPYHGNAFRVEFEIAPPMPGDTLSFNSLKVHARKYKGLGSSSLLAGRADYVNSTSAAGESIILGGPHTLRLLPYGSLIGNQVVYLSGEIRFPLLNYLVFPGNIAFGPIRGVLFADYGRTSFSGEKFPAQIGKSVGGVIQFLDSPVWGLPLNWGIGFPSDEKGKINFKKKVRVDFFVNVNW